MGRNQYISMKEVALHDKATVDPFDGVAAAGGMRSRPGGGSGRPVVTLLDGAGQAVGQGVLLEAGQEVLVPSSLAETAGLQVQTGEATIPVSGVEASGELAAVLRLEAQTRDALPLAAEDPGGILPGGGGFRPGRDVGLHGAHPGEPGGRLGLHLPG